MISDFAFNPLFQGDILGRSGSWDLAFSLPGFRLSRLLSKKTLSHYSPGFIALSLNSSKDKGLFP
jgi:hypothetical protein